MEKFEIKTLEMTRRIRDEHYKLLKGKTAAEKIQFILQKSQEYRKLMDIKASEFHPINRIAR